MRIDLVDYNGADVLLGTPYASEWRELVDVTRGMPLHLKASDQAGLVGNLIFDPVGTNAYLKQALVDLGWNAGVVIPDEFSFLGTDVDFVKGGLLGEVQFSNYPVPAQQRNSERIVLQSEGAARGHALRGCRDRDKREDVPSLE